MLSISTVEEAVAYLVRETGQSWSPSRLFDVAVAHQIALLAVVPAGITTVTVRADSATSGHLEDVQNHLFAQVPPNLVRQVWLRGVAEARLAADVDGVLGEYSQLSSPVRVTTKDVLVSAAALEALLKVAGQVKAATAVTAPVPRFDAQCATLLREIELIDRCPTALPRNIAGRPGIKAELKGKCLQQRDVFQSGWVFEHTWRAMRSLGEIAYDDESSITPGA
jgi:hypothetical protein